MAGMKHLMKFCSGKLCCLLFCTLIYEVNLIFIAGCTFATLPRTIKSIPLVLGEDPHGKTFLYTHDKTVIIRDIEVSRAPAKREY